MNFQLPLFSLVLLLSSCVQGYYYYNNGSSLGFTIMPKSFTIGQPGEIFCSNPNNTDFVNLSLYQGSGTTDLLSWKLITQTTATGGSYEGFNWTAPASVQPGDQYLFAIRNATSVGYSNPFSILAASGTPSTSTPASSATSSSTAQATPNGSSALSYKGKAVLAIGSTAAAILAMI